MELVWIIYLIDTLTPNPGLVLVTSLLGVALVIFGFIKLVEPSAKEPLEQVPSRFLWTLFTLLLLWMVLFPSKDTAYKMLAAYGVVAVSQTEEAQRLGGKSLEVLEKAMDEYLKASEAKE